MIEVIVCDKELYSPADIAPKTLGSAGLDLKLTRDAKSAHQISAEGGEWPYQDLIGTGLKVRVPTNMVGLIVPRSSAGHKHGFRIGNTVGIINSDYRGEIMMSIGGGDYGLLKRGATVAQLILVPYSSFYGATVVDQFSDETVRGEGGFGSTDKQWQGIPKVSDEHNGILSTMNGATACCTDLLPEQVLSINRDLDLSYSQAEIEQREEQAQLDKLNGRF